jgi:uncharacterized BrkB/YihY/UPF0761 family membrane protein
MRLETRTLRVLSTIRGLFRSFKPKNAITLTASVSFFAFLSLFPFLMSVLIFFFGAPIGVELP